MRGRGRVVFSVLGFSVSACTLERTECESRTPFLRKPCRLGSKNQSLKRDATMLKFKNKYRHFTVSNIVFSPDDREDYSMSTDVVTS